MELNSLFAVVISVLIVTIGTYLCINALVKSQADRKLWDRKIAHAQLITPLRLQAYERMCLFLERITPNNLILRVAPSASTAPELHQILLREIREEFNHNLSQQVYIGIDTWEIVRNAKEEVISTINLASQEVSKEATANELARQIMKRVIESGNPAVSTALEVLKKEIQVLF